jgi:urease accessory protein
VAAYASTTLPFVLAAHREPSFASLAALDDALDAALVCTVGRRASVAQGHALLAIWDRSLSPALPPAAVDVLRPFSALLKKSGAPPPAAAASSFGRLGTDARHGATNNDMMRTPPLVSAHLAPLFGAIANLLGLSARQTGYVFMLAHVKALVSAAVRVRSGMIGPFQGQKVLASRRVQELVAAAVDREWDTLPENAAQSVPVMDLWAGRHELLYSRIFNS